MLVKAYRVLDALDDQGVDIGEAGRALLDEIADRLPPKQLEGE
jgi:hypothetical protein